MIKFSQTFFASCPRGLEELLAQEVHALDVKSQHVLPARVEFESKNEKVLELIFTSRIASRVFKKFLSFEFHDWNDFSQALQQINWKTIFSGEASFKVTTTLMSKPSLFPTWLNNTIYPSQLVKDALIDHHRAKGLPRPIIDLKRPQVHLHLHLFAPLRGDTLRAELSVDLCLEALSHRGYRPMAQGDVAAPLRENVAAALLRYSQWRPQAEPLIDCFCGSGTILLEGLLMALNVPASYQKLLRYRQSPAIPQWGFQFLPWFFRDQYLQVHFDQLLERLLPLCHPAVQWEHLSQAERPELIGIDIDPWALAATQRGAEFILSGKKNGIKTWQGDVTGLSRVQTEQLFHLSPEKNCLLMGNMPYGQRLAADHELYHRTGEMLKHHWGGSRAYLVASDRELYKQIALKPSRKLIFQQGDLEVKCLEYPLRRFNPRQE